MGGFLNVDRAWILIGACVGVAILLNGLVLLLLREWVKSNLHEKGGVPVRIRWRPLASTRATTRFWVIYRDVLGTLHHARCAVHPFRREVIWEWDEPLEPGSAHDTLG